MLQKPLPISVAVAKLWQAVGNLGGIRSQRSGRETEGSWGVGLCFYSWSCALPRQHTFRGLEMLCQTVCSVLHISPLISFWSFQPWSHYQSPPLLPLFNSFLCINLYGKHPVKDIIALWGNMRVELATFTQCIDRLLATIAVDILQRSLFFLIQCRGHQGRCVAYSGTATVTTSLFLMACASHWASNGGRQLYWVYYAWSSHQMITPSMSHIQNSRGILSRFPLKGEERRIFLL